MLESRSLQMIPDIQEGEIFKPLHDSYNSEGYYVSNLNRMYSFKTKKFLSLNPNPIYVYASISQIDKKPLKRFFHELVMVTFVGPRPENMQIDHINRIPHDNRLENLRYVTISENNLNKEKIIFEKSRNMMKPIEMTDKDGLLIIFQSMKDIVDEMGYSRKILDRRIKTGKDIDGYTFKYHYEPILEGEVWKDITINNIQIKVSNKGRICKNNLYTYGTEHKNKYMRIEIGTQFLVHRIVCETFKGKPINSKMVVNHIDENRSNNCIENLEWVTQLENMKHSLSKGVKQYTIEGIFIEEFRDSKLASVKTGANEKSIRNCCNRKYKTSGGYTWKWS